jgi:hypothetical protein
VALLRGVLESLIGAERYGCACFLCDFQEFPKQHSHWRDREARAMTALLQPVTVDRRSENPRVGGSIPPLGTIFFNELSKKWRA